MGEEQEDEDERGCSEGAGLLVLDLGWMELGTKPEQNRPGAEWETERRRPGGVLLSAGVTEYRKEHRHDAKVRT